MTRVIDIREEKEAAVKVIITPLTQRAKNDIKNHGKIMWMLRQEPFQGEPAILVESLEETCAFKKDQKTTWLGWFTEEECNFKEV